MTMAAKRTTPTEKVAALLKKTVANGCTRPEMISAQDVARTLCKKHGLDATRFVWPEVPAEARQPTAPAKPAPKRKRGPKAADKAPARKRKPTTMTWPPQADTKGHRVFEAIKSNGGATAEDLLELTGWLPHTLRGWVSYANKAGAGIGSTRVDGVTRYRLES
jgi:hypothetical protein